MNNLIDNIRIRFPSYDEVIASPRSQKFLALGRGGPQDEFFLIPGVLEVFDRGGWFPVSYEGRPTDHVDAPVSSAKMHVPTRRFFSMRTLKIAGTVAVLAAFISLLFVIVARADEPKPGVTAPAPAHQVWHRCPRSQYPYLQIQVFACAHGKVKPKVIVLDKQNYARFKGEFEQCTHSKVPPGKTIKVCANPDGTDGVPVIEEGTVPPGPEVRT